ncbi:EAL domain-containing protein [Comamonas sp. GB3 AK4-5]|uniref:EAL domain-containing protein n=1 Tax=Comamonas sp. GB3 AK4-5 TaxID=3231487 RepID=UPI00351ED454
MELTVLLIDGDCAHAEQVQQFLFSVRPRWRVLHATDLAGGQILHAQHLPQMAMVAFEQTDGDALQALRWLGSTMALVMVEFGQEELAALSMRAGFADFVVCPPQPGSSQHLQPLPEQLESLARQRATERALAEHSRELHSTLSSISQGVISMDAQGRVQLYNERALELLDIPEARMEQQPFLRELVAFQRERGEFDRALYWPPGATVGGIDGRYCPSVYIRRTQEGRYLEVRTHPERDGRKVRTYTDVTDYVQTQQQLSQSEQRWRSMTALSSDWFWELDGRLRFVHLDGCPDALQQSLHTQYFWAQTLWQQAYEASEKIAERQALMARREAFHDWELCHHDGNDQLTWLSLSGTPVWDEEGVFTGYRGVARNITERKQTEVAIRRLAYRDDLTELPNRAAMLQQIDQALERSLKHGAGALLLLDVDHFKGINDAMGHSWGDALLQEVARRLRAWCRPGDVVGRVGGDEFLVLIEALAPDMAQAQARASAMAVSLMGVLDQAYELQGRAVHASFGIGAAGFWGRDRSVDDMRQCVELALGEAKAQGRNAWSVFDPELQRSLRARAALEADLHIALDRGDFVLHYQPVVDDQGSVLGAEALVRWAHPERGMVPPGSFIPVAEQLGLIFALDRWVLRQACLQLAAWARHPISACWTLAVNLSAQEFRHADFLCRIQDILRDTGARPDLLKLELTESLMLEAVEDSIAKMQSLRAMGIRFSLDDFGMGYSSLGYLKRLPLSQLKIDQSFVRDVLLDANDAAIVRTVIALGQSLGLEVVAEGVETQGQLEFLVRNGCRRFQGYLFGRPDEAEVMLAQ